MAKPFPVYYETQQEEYNEEYIFFRHDWWNRTDKHKEFDAKEDHNIFMNNAVC
jgi:hypothetical protein